MAVEKADIRIIWAYIKKISKMENFIFEKLFI